ncbi:uncharacterized protein LOC116733197 [Xiphophorus hellerii]|uniref:uncharacterized protein LOC116733197 n=1 Tax=Xiphophorus hellerii TaxID=8084 RepID=UPI0013B3F240|nr:uncharacterized protein LOC116733197 [Xiphophorus hellerii]
MLENSSPNNSKMSYSDCLMTKPSIFIYTSFIAVNVVLLFPLFVSILYHGVQQRWKNCSSTVGHSDCFTFHLVVMELIGVCGCVISFGGIYSEKVTVVKVGTVLFSFTWLGEGLFLILTCVEHYLAVVHPIDYLGLKNKRGIKIRNVVLACVWLLCLVGLSLAVKDYYVVIDTCVVILTVTIVPYCSISALRVLTQAGPGQPGRDRADQSKQRAFYTIVTILGALTLRLFWNVIFIVCDLEEFSTNCIMMTCEALFNLPCSLVLPLLFLQRAGKLVCWEKNVIDD